MNTVNKADFARLVIDHVDLARYQGYYPMYLCNGKKFNQPIKDSLIGRDTQLISSFQETIPNNRDSMVAYFNIFYISVS